MSLRLDKGKYYVVVYGKGGKRVQEYIGADERVAVERQVEILRERAMDIQGKLGVAEQHLKELAVKS